MRNVWLLFLVGLATGFIGEKKSTVSTTDDLYLEGRTSGDLPIDDEDGEDEGSGSGSGDYAFSDISDKEELLRRFLNFTKTTVSKETIPVQRQPTADSPHIPPTTAPDSHVQTAMEKTPYIFPDGDNSDKEVLGSTDDCVQGIESTTSADMPFSEPTTSDVSIDIHLTKDSNEDNSLDRWGSTTSRDGKDKVLRKEEVDNEVRANDQGLKHKFDSPEEVTSENLWERTEVLAAVIACGVVGFLCAVFLLLLLAYRMKKKDEGSYDLGDTKLSTTAYHKAPTKEFYA